MADTVDPALSPAMTAEQLATLTRERDLIRELTRDIGDFNKNIEESVSKTKEFFKGIKSSEAEVLNLSAAQGSLNDKLNLFNNTLKAEADIISRTSGLFRESLNTAIQENIKLEEILKDLVNENGKAAKEKKEQLEKAKEAQEALSDADKNHVDALKDLIKNETSLSDAVKDKIRANFSSADSIDKLIVLAREQIDLNNVNRKYDAQSIIDQVNHNEELKKRLPLELSLLDIQKLQTDHTTKVNQAMDGLIDRFGITSNKANIFTSAVISATKGTGGLGKALISGFMEDLLSPEKALNRFFNFINDFAIKSSFELNKTLADVNKQLGGMGKEFEEIALRKGSFFSETAVADLAVYGLGLKDLGHAYGALSKTVGNFNNLSVSQRDLLATNAAKMENLGISAELYASMSAKLMGAMGKTAEGADHYIKKLASDAAAAGSDIGEYAKKFDQLMPKLMGYGREASEIYRQLNAVVQSANGSLQVSDLVSFAENFNDFDKAAMVVSNFNSALGGMYLNLTDVYSKDPMEIALKFKEAFNRTGKDFKELNLGFQNMLAEPFGGNRGLAAEVYNSDLSKTYEILSRIGEEQESLEERNKKSADAQKKLNAAIDSMKISLTPIVEAVATVAQTLASWGENVGGFKQFLFVSAVLGITGLVSLIRLVGTTITTAIGGALSNVQLQLEVISFQMMQLNGFHGPLPPGPGQGGAPPPPGAAPGGIGGRGMGLLAIGLMVAGTAITAYSASQAKKEPTEEEKKKNIPKLTSGAGDTSNIVIGKALDLEGKQPIFTMKNGMPNLIAAAAGDDKFKVQARNESDLAAANEPFARPMVEAVGAMSTYSRESYNAISDLKVLQMTQSRNLEIRNTSSERNNTFTNNKLSEKEFATAIGSKIVISPNFSFDGLQVAESQAAANKRNKELQRLFRESQASQTRLDNFMDDGTV